MCVCVCVRGRGGVVQDRRCFNVIAVLGLIIIVTLARRPCVRVGTRHNYPRAYRLDALNSLGNR